MAARISVLMIKTEVYSRVSGYFRPVNQYNKAKQEEYKDRKKAIIKTLEDVNGKNMDEY